MAAADQARLECLEGYSGMRRYVLDNRRFGTHAELQVRMTFEPPSAKTFEVVSARGAKVIRGKVLQRLIETEQEAARPEVRARTQITPDNYNFQLAGTAVEQDRGYYILDLEPVNPTKYLFRGRVWVDAEEFAIARIEGAPAVNPSFWIHRTRFVHTYRKFGAAWLPTSNRSESDVRVFGKTHVTVDYTGYAQTPSACTHSPSAGATEP